MEGTPIDGLLNRKALQESGTSRYIAILVCYKDPSGRLICYSEPETNRLKNFYFYDTAQKLASSLKEIDDKNRGWQVYKMTFEFEKVEKKE